MLTSDLELGLDQRKHVAGVRGTHAQGSEDASQREERQVGDAEGVQADDGARGHMTDVATEGDLTGGGRAQLPNAPATEQRGGEHPQSRGGRRRAGEEGSTRGRGGGQGSAIMWVREGLEFETEIASDTAALNGLVYEILAA